MYVVADDICRKALCCNLSILIDMATQHNDGETDGRHFAEDIFKLILFNENFRTLVDQSRKSPIKTALVKIMDRHGTGASHCLNQWWSGFLVNEFDNEYHNKHRSNTSYCAVFLFPCRLLMRAQKLISLCSIKPRYHFQMNIEGLCGLMLVTIDIKSDKIFQTSRHPWLNLK